MGGGGSQEIRHQKRPNGMNLHLYLGCREDGAVNLTIVGHRDVQLGRVEEELGGHRLQAQLFVRRGVVGEPGYNESWLVSGSSLT